LVKFTINNSDEVIMSVLPKRFERFLREYPEIAVAYETLGDAIHREGSLTEKERVLVKLAISAGAGMEGAVHAQVRKALKAKLTKSEIRQVALLAIPTVGFPASMAVMSWIDDILDKKKGK
jgi:alkylhydroperoxidase/carboxymuconolactone decarboxylase family protein YurZ